MEKFESFGTKAPMALLKRCRSQCRGRQTSQMKEKIMEESSNKELNDEISVIELEAGSAPSGDESSLEEDLIQLERTAPDEKQEIEKDEISMPEGTKRADIQKYLLNAGVEKRKVDIFVQSLQGGLKGIFHFFCIKAKNSKYELTTAKNKQVYFQHVNKIQAAMLVNWKFTVQIATLFHKADLDVLALSFLACHLPTKFKSLKSAYQRNMLDTFHSFLKFGIDNLPMEVERIFNDSKTGMQANMQSHIFFKVLAYNQKSRPSRLKKYKEFLHEFGIDTEKYSKAANPTIRQLSNVYFVYIQTIKLENKKIGDADDIIWSGHDSAQGLSSIERCSNEICSVTKLIGKCGSPGAALATAMHCVLLDAAPHVNSEKIDRKLLEETSSWLIINAPLNNYSKKMLALLDGSIPAGEKGGHAREFIDHLLAKKKGTTTTTTTTTSTAKPTHATSPTGHATRTSTSTRTPTTTSGTTPPARTATTTSTATHTPTTTSGTNEKDKEKDKNKDPKK